MQITVTTEAIEAEAAEYQKQSDTLVTRANALSGAAQALRAFSAKSVQQAKDAADAAAAAEAAAAAAIQTPVEVVADVAAPAPADATST